MSATTATTFNDLRVFLALVGQLLDFVLVFFFLCGIRAMEVWGVRDKIDMESILVVERHGLVLKERKKVL